MINPIKFFAVGTNKDSIGDAGRVSSLYKHHRIAIMLAITFGYGSYYVCRLVLSVAKKPLLDNGIFTLEELGLIGSAIFFGYAFGKLINGFLADYANVRKIFTLGLLSSAAINIVMGCSSTLWVFVALWGLNGWFQAFGAPASIVTLSNWFSNRERGRYYGIWSSSHSIGEGITYLGTTAIISYFSWRAGFIVSGLFCVIIAIVACFFMRDRPQTLGLPAIVDWHNDHGLAIESDDKPLSTNTVQMKIFKRPALYVLALASAMMYVSRYAIANWGILYLQEVKGYSLVEAGGLMGLNTIAGIAGCIVYGFVSDKLFNARRPPVTLIFGILEILSLCVIFYSAPGQNFLLSVGFVVFGFTLSGLLAVVGGLFAIDIMPKRAAGAVAGFIGVSSYIGAALQERVSAYLINDGVSIVEGVRAYDFSKAIIFWIGASVVSMILAASLWRVKNMD